MKLILLGPPGVGKGTQAQKICEQFDSVQISTGDMLRSEIAAGTALGKKADRIISEGSLVPDDIILGMIKNRLFVGEKPTNYILDGFPRTIEQAKGLEKLYSDHHDSLDKVLLFEAPEEMIIDRISARRSCSNCKKVYHLVAMPPKKKGVCDSCGGKLVQREDDKPETIKKRLKVYHEQTEPLVDFYKKRQLLEKIDATGTPEDVAKKVMTVLKG